MEVEELDDGASVSDVLFRNLSDKPVLLFEGEELLGAMQNRILNVSVLVPPKTKQNTSCFLRRSRSLAPHGTRPPEAEVLCG